jgi:Undecaprenyl-phosphate galactose phosphotransferase WbaP
MYQAWWGLPVVVMGTGQKARKTVRNLNDLPWLGLKPICVVDDDLAGASLAFGSGGGGATVGAAVDSIGIPAHVRGVPLMRNLAAVSWGITSLDPARCVPFDGAGLPARVIGPKLLDRCLVKRLFDASLASLLLVLASPLWVLIAVLIKLDSRGPVLYGHTRIGHNKKPFRAWKFRSMASNADEVLESYLRSHPVARREWEQTQKIKDDPRVTRVGKLLRKTSLDELPQIWNVLLGEMSLVGPRPIVNDEIPRYGDQFDLFVSVKPGLTGLWQVSGRNNTTYEERVQLDIHYVRHWSPWMDLGILLKTVPVVLLGHGAY